jgi:nucleoside-diphosphate-sugar epimerase
MHTILGARGVIGRELSRALSADSIPVRQVSRAPQRRDPSDEVRSADLLDAQGTDRALAGSDVAYLVAGLKYDTAAWQDQWPRIMRNVIDACSRHNCKLVFFDNVYAYGRVNGVMTEETPFNPTSKKGEVRAKIATMLLDAMRAGTVRGMIVRAADFYGPHALLSMTHAVVFERIRDGKTPQWIGNPNAVHTFTFTPDAGRGVAKLGQSDKAYGQTWHAPTTKEPLTAADFVKVACTLAKRPYKLQRVPRVMLKLMALFVPVLRENMEMMYQFDDDYRFDSSKIEREYGLVPTPYSDGISATLNAKS